MDFGLEGKRAFVSGSTSGIGAGIARMLAAHGATVVVHGRDRARAAQVVADIEGGGGRAVVALGDIGVDGEVDALAAAVDADLGGIDILVNNAGDAQPFSPDWFAASPDQWLGTYNRNVVSAVRLIQKFVPGMRERGWGRVIMIGSNAYTLPPVDFPTYPPSKAALVNVAISLARVLANSGVTANTVSPGAVLTETMATNLQPMAAAQGWAETDPAIIERRLVSDKWPNFIGRMGRPDDIASAVTFVASELSGYMTGAHIRIDGGNGASFH